MEVMWSTRSILRALAYSAWLSCSACDGARVEPAHTDAPLCHAAMPDTLAASELPDVWNMRRLSRDELARTYEALLGITPESVRQLPSDGAHAPAPSSFEVELYRQIAKQAADQGSSALLSAWACDGDVDCTRAAAARWIERAQREPLSPEERDAYLAILPSSGDARPALRGLLELIFQSPRFLYVIERGISRDAQEDSRELTPWELATRLSYFLWSEPPDDALQNEAESARLSDPSALRAQAERMVKDPRAARMLGAVLQQLAAPELDVVAKAQSVYPQWDPELRASMVEQFTRFAAMAIADGSNLNTLFTTQRLPLDARLRALLGVAADKREGWKIADVAPRFGLLTLPGVLTSNARSDDSSPVQRGLFIRQNVLCQSIAPPPAGVPALPPADSSGTSFRERFEAHTKSPVCASCHQFMDPLGFPFEIYDGLGRLRPNIDSIRTAGKLDGVGTPAEFDDLQGLVDALLTAPEVSRCWAQQWMTRALGTDASGEDELLESLASKVRDGASFSELIVQIVSSSAFNRVHRPRVD
jgi:hypothetical protein